MNIDLSRKTAIVTGSTAGIGFATARALAECGATVILNGRTKAAVEKAVARVKSAVSSADVRGVAADLGSAAGCDALVRAEPDCGILVNNVGIFGPQDFFDIPDSEWTRFFEVNVMSGVRLARAYMPAMLSRNWGRVVFLSSESALNIPVEMIHYGFTKTAVLAISRGLAKRAAGTGVTVNAVLPGPTLSEGVERMLAQTPRKAGRSVEEAAVEFVKTMRPSSIIARAATPEEVANMVVYAVSPRVDGGVVEMIV
jgi:NAD(P)-dependent dehydrogenase (short-subunit alcohol dehydrogenase family)